MNRRLKNEMEKSWKRWHGNDIDTPSDSPAFQCGFIVACEVLLPLLVQALPHVAATAEASHLTDGFKKRKKNENDRLVDSIRIVLTSLAISGKISTYCLLSAGNSSIYCDIGD